MKQFFFLVAILLFGGAASANNVEHNNVPYGYGNSFIFTEGGVEFSVYPNGEFDFYYIGHPVGTNVQINTPNVNISYNAGYNYDAFVQYDDYGAVIQIENIPIFYDYYGRIIRAGNVQIHYNNFGRIARIGGLYVHYNRYNQFAYHTGFINRYNRYYVYRPWHTYYIAPRPQFAIVYHMPYRTYYTPARMDYNVYRNEPRKRATTQFYRPNDNVVAYNRGRRTSAPRDLTRELNERSSVSSRSDFNSERSNAVTQRRNSNRNRNDITDSPRSNRAVVSTPERSIDRTERNSSSVRVQNPRRTETRTQTVPARTERRMEVDSPSRTQNRTFSTPSRSERNIKTSSNSRSSNSQINRSSQPTRNAAPARTNSRSQGATMRSAR